MKKVPPILFFICLLLPHFLFGHGDLDIQIELISKRIQEEPRNAKLHLKRGQLYVQHKEFNKGEQDYNIARKLDKNLLITDLLMAQLFSESNKAKVAMTYINIYLKNHPLHPTGLISRAKIYQQLGQSDLCQKDLESAIAEIKDPTPTHYISIAEAVLRNDTSNVEEALSWLKKGGKKFSFDIVLKSKELDLYILNKQYENALAVIDQIMERFPRKEKWLFQKAMVYETTGNIEQAKTYYDATLNEIHKLPKRLQMTSKILELEVQTLEKIKSLSQ